MGAYQLERSAEVAASAQAVWDQLVDVKSWPEWKPFITATSSNEKVLSRDSRFKMNIRVKGRWPVPISARVCAWEEGKRIAWTAGLPGLAVSVHSFILEQLEGKTRVRSREEFTGALVGLMLRLVTEKDLHSLHDQWLASIKQRVEKLNCD